MSRPRLIVDLAAQPDLHSGSSRRGLELFRRVAPRLLEHCDICFMLSSPSVDGFRDILPASAGIEFVVHDEAFAGPWQRKRRHHPRLRALLDERSLLLQESRPLLSPERSLVTVHDLRIVEPSIVGSLRAALARRLLVPAYRRARGIVTVSEFTRRGLIGLGIPDDRIEVIPNGVDVASFADASIEPLEELGLTASGYVFAVGHDEYRKNHEFAIELMSTLPPGMELVLAGRGVSRHGERDGLRLFDAPSDKQLRALYRGARVVLCPSLYEGFGIVPLEARAAGRPLIASDIPAHREHSAELCLALDADAWRARLDELLAQPERGVRPLETSASWDASAEAFERWIAGALLP